MKKKLIYCTNEWDGHAKQSYYHNEYRQEDDTILKVKCGRQRYFDGEESAWHETERVVDKWKTDDPSMPSWLKDLL